MRTRRGLGLLALAIGLLVAGMAGVGGGGGGEPSPPPTTTTSTLPGPSSSSVPEPALAPSTSTTSTTIRPATTSTTRPSRSAGRATTTTPPARVPVPATPTTKAAVRPVPAPATTTTTAAAPAGNTATDALQALNRDRSARGLPALRVRSDLQAKAQAWAEKMARENALYHSTLRDGLAPCWTALGENIAPGSSVTEAERLLMDEPAHRANILRNWDWVGVGVAPTGRGLIVVQVFMSGCP